MSSMDFAFQELALCGKISGIPDFTTPLMHLNPDFLQHAGISLPISPGSSRINMG